MICGIASKQTSIIIDEYNLVKFILSLLFSMGFFKSLFSGLFEEFCSSLGYLLLVMVHIH